MNIFDRVKSLNLPEGHYVVFGSGPMVARGLKPYRDVDILVTTELYQVLKTRSGWEEKNWDESRGQYLSYNQDEVQADDNWNYGSYQPDPSRLIKRAEIIQGVPFAPLEEVRKWKQAYNRPKDQADLSILEAFLHDPKAFKTEP